MQITPQINESISLGNQTTPLNEANKDHGTYDQNTDGNNRYGYEPREIPVPSAPELEVQAPTVPDAQPPSTQNSTKPSTNVQVNTNTKVDVNLTINPADLQRMISTSSSGAQPDYEPSPGLPSTVEDPLSYPQLPTTVTDMEQPVNASCGKTPLATSEVKEKVSKPKTFSVRI